MHFHGFRWYGALMGVVFRNGLAYVVRALPWLALMAHLALGAVLPADPLARVLTQSVMDCQASGSPTPVVPHHHAPNGYTLSPLCLADVAPSLTPTDGAIIPLPAVHYLGRAAAIASARAPPEPARHRPPTRAPPASV